MTADSAYVKFYSMFIRVNECFALKFELFHTIIPLHACCIYIVIAVRYRQPAGSKCTLFIAAYVISSCCISRNLSPNIGGHLAFYIKLNSKLSHKILKIDLNVCCYFHCNRVKQCYAKIKARI